MDRMIYVAMSAARSAQQAQTVTSHNIANISTNGFRAIRSGLDSAPIPGQGLPSRVNTVAQPEVWSTTQGASLATGRDLDIAIQGPGWLAVQGLDDEYGTLEQIRGIARRVPQTQLLELPACGHSPHKDQPEAVIDAARALLARALSAI